MAFYMSQKVQDRGALLLLWMRQQDSYSSKNWRLAPFWFDGRTFSFAIDRKLASSLSIALHYFKRRRPMGASVVR